MKLLFVCSNNLNRSKTAEDLYKNDTRFQVKSAGVNVGATQGVTKELVNWADAIVVMNEKVERHIFKIYQKFSYLEPMKKKIVDFDIPDTFLRGDPKLIELIKTKMQENFPERIK